jgi:hypothetical protein
MLYSSVILGGIGPSGVVARVSVASEAKRVRGLNKRIVNSREMQSKSREKRELGKLRRPCLYTRDAP